MIDITPFIPLNKSWLNRMGLLDLRYGNGQILKTLAGSKVALSDDLKMLLNASLSYPRQAQDVVVGESGTLYRFLLFLSWIQGRTKNFILSGTLKKRKITKNPKLVHWPLERLLQLDFGTSQWASAAVLCRDLEEKSSFDIPHMLALSFEAKEHWHMCRIEQRQWEVRLDDTIRYQAESFIRMLNQDEPEFIARHSEDYCFARAFGFMDKNEGLERWPYLQNHESNRILEMEKVLGQFANREIITSRDHRVVQAITMLAGLERKTPLFVENTECVSKSWPQFWDFIKATAAQ